MTTGKKMFGILAVLVAVLAISAITLPSLASSTVDQPIVEDSSTTSDVSATLNQTQTTTRTRVRLQVCEQAGVCSENCTQLQTRAQVRAMDGSCGDGDGTCLGDGAQNRFGISVQVGQGGGTQRQRRGGN